MAKHLNVNLQFTADTGQAKAQIQSLQQSLTQLSTTNISGKGMTGYTQEVGKAISKVNELKGILASSTNAAGGLDLGKFNQSLKQAGTSIDSYRQHLSKLGPEGKQAFAQLAQSISTASVPIKQTNGLLTEMATTLKNTARWQLTSSLIHGFMSSLQSAMSYAQGLDKSLTNIRIVTGMSADEMESFATRANKAAQALSTSTRAYSDAALIYYQQGLGNKEVEEKTDVTIKMANVTGDAAADVSSYLTAIWNNFNKDGTQAAEHYADIMTKLGAETAASTSEIAAGLSKFSAVADTIGLSFEMASSTVTAIVDQTREAPEVVGTALKTIFSRVEGLKMGETLEDGTDLNKYSAGLAKVGVDIKDASGNLRDMDSILHDIGDTWETLNKDEQVALAQTVAGVRQYNQFIAMFDNWDKVEENLERAADAGGTLEEQAEIYAESWEGARNRVKAAMEEIWGKVIDDDFFIGLNNFLADFLGIISEVIDSLGGMKGVLLLLSTALLNAFGKSMAANIDRFAYNIHLTSKKGQQELDTLRSKTAEAYRAMAKESGSGITGQAMAKTFQGTSEIQDRIIAKTKQIAAAGRQVSTEEQEFFNAVLETNKALSDQYMAIEKNREALSNQGKQAQDNNIRNMRAAAANNPDLKNTLQQNIKDYNNQSRAMQSTINTSTLGKNLQEQINQQINSGLSDSAIKKYIQDYTKEIESKGIPVTNKFKKVLQGISAKDFKLTNDIEQLTTEITRCDEKTAKLQSDMQNTFNKSGGTNNPKKQADEAANSMTNLANKTKEAVNAGVGLTTNTRQTKQDLDDLNNKPFTLGQKVTAVATAMSGLAMTITSINGMIDTLKDPDATGWEKFSAVLMTIGMTLPLLVSAFSMTNIQMLAGASASVAQAMGWSVAGKAAAVAAGEVTAFGTALWTALWPIGLVMLAIAGLIGIFVALYRQAHKAEREFKKASETAEQMNKRYEDSKTALEEVNTELDTLAKKREALGKLTKGTEEWNDALEESNNYVLDLIDKYPELAKYVYTDENGALAISQAGQNELVETKEREVKEAKVAKTSANIDKNQAEIEYNKDEIQSQIKGKTGARGQTQEISDAKYEKVLELASQYGTAIPEDLLLEAVGNDRSLYNSVIENLPQIVAMLAKNNALQESNNIQSKEIGKEILNKTGVKLTKQQKEDYKGIEGALGDEYERVYEDEKDKLEKQSRGQIINKYLAQNSGLTLLDKRDGKAAVFKDANGNEVKMTVDEMIDAIAANNAMDLVAEKWDKVADRLLGVNKNSPIAKEFAAEEEGGLSGNLGQAVFSVDQNGKFDISSLSSGDIDRLAEKEDVTAEDLGIANLDPTEYGFATHEEWVDAFMTQIREASDLYNQEDDRASSGAVHALNSDDDTDNINEGEVETNRDTFTNYEDEHLKWKNKGVNEDAFTSRSNAGFYDEDERNDIVAEAGVDEGYYNDQKAGIAKTMTTREATWNSETNTVEISDTVQSYGELEDAYNKYQKAMEAGNKKEAKQWEAQAKQFKKAEGQLEDLAAAQVEMNDGAGELVENWDAWSAALKKGEGTDEYATAIDNVRASTAKMLNVSEDAMSDEFIQTHLKDIEAAANGNVEAMDRLREAYGQEYVANMEINGVNEEDINNIRDRLNNEIIPGLAAEISDLSLHASLDDSQYIAALNEMLAKGQITEAQVNEVLSGMGYEPQIESVPATLFSGGWPESDIPISIAGKELFTIDAGLIPEIKLPIRVPQITGGNKKSNKTNPITGNTTTPRSPRSPSGTRRTTTRRPEKRYIAKKDQQEEIERYHVVNNELEDMEHKLNMIDKAKERAFGKDKLQKMDEEAAALQKNIELQRKYQKEIKTNLAKDKNKLAGNPATGKKGLIQEKLGMNVEFDEAGTITNWEAIKQANLKKFEDGRKKYKNMTAKEQAKLDEEYSKKINPETGQKYSGYEDYLNAEYEKINKALEQYEETQDLAKEVEEEIQDSLNELYDLKLEKLQYELELDLQITEDDQKILDFLMDRTGDDAWRTAEQVAIHDQTIQNSQANIQSHEDTIRGIFAGHEGIDGDAVMDAILSGDSATAMELLQGAHLTEAEIEQIRESSAAILDETSTIKDAQMAVVDSVGDLFDAHMEAFDNISNSIASTTEYLQAYGEIIDIVGRKQLGISEEQMRGMEDRSMALASNATANAKYKAEKAKVEYDYAVQQLSDAELTGDKELISHWKAVVQQTKEGMEEAKNEWMAAWTAQLEQAQQIFDARIQRSVEDFTSAMAGKAGSGEGLSAQLELHAMVDDNYLEDYEKIYELNKLTREIGKSIDDTSNIKAKRELLELEEKIVQAKESGNKMSEYEVQQLRKQYELKLAEIALEEAKSAKSEVRMTKDSEGNFSYVYTANEDAVEDAEQNYEDKLKEYQELNHNYIKDLESQMGELSDRMGQEISSAAEMYGYGTQEYFDAVALIEQKYTEEYNFLAEQMNMVLSDNKRLHEEDVAMYAETINAREMLNMEYISDFSQLPLSIATGFSDMKTYTETWQKETDLLFNQAEKDAQDYNTTVSSVMQANTAEGQTFAEKLDETLSSVASVNSSYGEEITSVVQQITTSWDETIKAVSNFASTYNQILSDLSTKNQKFAETISTVLDMWRKIEDESTTPAPEEPSGGDPPSSPRTNTPSNPPRSGDDGVVKKGEVVRLKRSGKLAVSSDRRPTLTPLRRYQGAELYVQMINRGARSPYHLGTRKRYSRSSAVGWVDKKQISGFDTGGYTGKWAGGSGKLAMLHQKEIVLNAGDTENFLKTVDIVRQISQTIDLNALSSAGGLSAGLHAARAGGLSNDTLEQNVHITAEFPNATDKNEIIKAFDNVINLAAQYSNQKNRKR